MDEEECRKIIAIGKHPKEVRVEQMSRKVLRPDVSVPSEWKLIEEVLAKVRGMARERLEAERERCWVKDGSRANRVEALREGAEKAVLELHSILDTMRAELVEVRDNAEGVSLAKQDLEQALAVITTEVGDLYLHKFGTEASLLRLSNQAEHAREEAFRLLSELDVVQAKQDEVVGEASSAEEKVLRSSTELIALRSKIEALRAYGGSSCTREVSILQKRVIVLSSRESELLAEFEIIRAKVAWLRMELEMLRAKLLQEVSTQGGNALSSGSIPASTHVLVIAEYL
ncbi:hypothetical protein ACLOJK_027446 [Asimina triloba]